jgi:hypothetical protein
MTKTFQLVIVLLVGSILITLAVDVAVDLVMRWAGKGAWASGRLTAPLPFARHKQEKMHNALGRIIKALERRASL